MSSVLTSADMSVDRSSTKRHAPPGGKTTFQIGDYQREVPVESKPVIKPEEVAVVETPVEQVPESAEEEVEIDPDSKIGIIAVLTDETELLLASTKTALGSIGFSSVTISTVSDALMLPYAAQVMLKSTDIVIGLGIVPTDADANTIISCLLQVGVVAGAPVVPGVFSSIDEVSELGVTVAGIAADMLAIKTSLVTVQELLGDGGATDTAAPPVVEAASEIPPAVPTVETAAAASDTPAAGSVTKGKKFNTSTVFSDNSTEEKVQSRSVANSTNPGRAVGGKSTIMFG
mmetsp:Transcript_355/g.346  ORF Transcript_355/g.346 Transcript_355/m.346 type:complete len:288 (+) Transcript_355:64-927(+)|eukprot:CAMPEP_0182428196 /NCGR_PEP_ID=MMETSP1167-20130531/21413_1 /TAXON_ID=2988 /ORGANISM="Mallomonas Sp, Strain CCMP3275" /LENGTH=287 /DNA_ID=CAMNT_0024610941 /DNA_START=54 /DNA_END=917 /DNA_ORIENTATION=+